MEKLRREVARLHSELERMEKEVARQKNLRWAFHSHRCQCPDPVVLAFYF